MINITGNRNWDSNKYILFYIDLFMFTALSNLLIRPFQVTCNVSRTGVNYFSDSKAKTKTEM